MKIEEILFLLLKVEFKAQHLSDEQLTSLKKELGEEESKKLFNLSKKHDYAHVVAKVLQDNGLLTDKDSAYKDFQKERTLALYRYENQEHVLSQVCQALDGASVDFVPLKGAIIRQMYPDPVQRTSCDVDVLVRKEQFDKAQRVLLDLGYEKKKNKGFHDQGFISPAGVLVELHFSVREDYKAVDGLLKNAWGYAEKVDESFEYRFTDEFFVFYHVAHTAKHFLDGGCGVKPFVDLWFIRNNLNPNEKALLKMLESAKMVKFFNAMTQLTDAWLGDGDRNEKVASLEKYVLSGGVYGCRENKIVLDKSKRGGGLRYYLKRLFMPYENLKVEYPVLEKNKWLTPVYQVVRWFSALFGRKSANRKKEMVALKSVDDSAVEETKKLIEYTGL